MRVEKARRLTRHYNSTVMLLKIFHPIFQRFYYPWVLVFNYSKMYPLESTEVRFQNYVTVFSRVLHVIYKWDVLLNYLLLFLYVNEWYFCSSLLIPYYLVTIKIVIYIYVKTFQKHIPDDITLEYTVYVALLEKKFTLHLLSLFTTPLLGMTKKIALA